MPLPEQVFSYNPLVRFGRNSAGVSSGLIGGKPPPTLILRQAHHV
jgi:hypothetical protein